MRIGELSERTGTSRRLLRYYEEQGLIAAARGANGYREFDERFVDRVLQIRGLLDAGLPTRIIKQILPCLDKPRTIYFRDATPEMIATLRHERDRMTERIRFLTHNRDAIGEYLDAVLDYDRGGAPADGGGAGGEGGGAASPPATAPTTPTAPAAPAGE
ncbi:MerR family transcriptional regulator [Streptomyces albus]|uniref:MerR family transcriptional regulator n=1 Tax=Streptomyces albus (strain ATCC 21838 / DSM 41398 / FERM P-419 / JCM 4703 / NBRC 107858) TaxID=1081613 RepID=A0A0B5EPX2_STRA4|nr:MerR family transcriptional regulator [Streptomyces albus]AOU79108.1 MerR family transcriptional regulator [Streptomyces albus]AYN34841.1 MerR family transcriptional regulator [Streptomyces albus]